MTGGKKKINKCFSVSLSYCCFKLGPKFRQYKNKETKPPLGRSFGLALQL